MVQCSLNAFSTLSIQYLVARGRSIGAGVGHKEQHTVRVCILYIVYVYACVHPLECIRSL